MIFAPAEQAIQRLRVNRFDEMITDIRMRHNQDMRIVREAHNLDQDMAIIMATGYPSTETAVQSVELPVAAYMTKPLDFGELQWHIQTALKSSKRRRVIEGVVERLQTCQADLETAK